MIEYFKQRVWELSFASAFCLPFIFMPKEAYTNGGEVIMRPLFIVFYIAIVTITLIKKR